MEKVVNVDLSAPLNLSFVDKRDPQGRFIRNSGVMSEAGLHNAFEERGAGQWIGDLDRGEIMRQAGTSTVIDVNPISHGTFIYQYSGRQSFRQVTLPDAIPSNWLDRQWVPSSGDSDRQFLCAVRLLTNNRLDIEILDFSAPVLLRTFMIPIDRSIHSFYSREQDGIQYRTDAIRIVPGELGMRTIADIIGNNIRQIRLLPVTFQDRLFIGIDFGISHVNSCFVADIVPISQIMQEGFSISRSFYVIKGFFNPGLDGVIRGDIIPESFVSTFGGFIPWRKVGASVNAIYANEINEHNSGLILHGGEIYFIRSDEVTRDYFESDDAFSYTMTDRLVTGLRFNRGSFTIEYSPLSNRVIGAHRFLLGAHTVDLSADCWNDSPSFVSHSIGIHGVEIRGLGKLSGNNPVYAPYGVMQYSKTKNLRTIRAHAPNHTSSPEVDRFEVGSSMVLISIPSAFAVTIDATNSEGRITSSLDGPIVSLRSRTERFETNGCVMFSGNILLRQTHSLADTMEVSDVTPSIGIFDALLWGDPSGTIRLFATVARGEVLWLSINDTKVANGMPRQVLTHNNRLMLVYDDFTVYADASNDNGTLTPDIRLLFPNMAVISQTGDNLAERRDGILHVSHAFSGLGYQTNIIGPRHTPNTDEVQSNFQDILAINRNGNVMPPNALSLPGHFMAITPNYFQRIQHVNINTPSHLIGENINAFRYSFPVNVRRGPTLDQWMNVQGNNTNAYIIDGRLSLTGDVQGDRPTLKQLVILGQLFEHDEKFITPVDIESGVRVYGQSLGIFNKIFAGSSSLRAYFFDLVSKTIDSFELDSGFNVGLPQDLVDRIIDAVPLNEFSYVNTRILDNSGGTKEVLLHMADSGVFFRDFGDLEVGDSTMFVGIGGLLLQGRSGWRILRNTVLFEHLEDIARHQGRGRFNWLPQKWQTGFMGEDGVFITPRFWEVDFYLSATARKIYEGREDEKIKVKMGTFSIHDRKKWSQPAMELEMSVRDFRDGYYTMRYECLAEECASQSLELETDGYVHVSAVAFKYVTGSSGTDR